MTNPQLLIVEDDADMQAALRDILTAAGYDVAVPPDGRAALALIKREHEPLDLVVTDVQMPGVKGDEILRAVRACRAETPVIIITAFGSVEHAVELVKQGAYQYLTKPFKAQELRDAVQQALLHSAPQREQARLRREMPAAPTRIVGASRPLRELFDLLPRAAQSSSTVLITGESGTGKELIARSLHELSERRGRFVPVNCTAIPAELIEAELFGHTGQAFSGAKQARAGLFETADQGTLFLDEIGDLPMSIQPKLLRALQESMIRRVGSSLEQPINARVVAATNLDLETEVREGRFRKDLFWRLNVIHLHVPALRERPFDIPLLVEHFLNKAALAAGRAPLDVKPDALALLTAYTWPGNVRELENVVERAVALARGAQLTPADLPERIRTGGDAAILISRAGERDLTMYEVERDYILLVMRRTGGNKSRAAEILNLDRKTLYRKLDDYRAEGFHFDQ